MYISFLVPPIHDRPTGGNIYNRRIITKLQRLANAEAVSWAPDANTDLPDLRNNRVVVVDSLLTRHPAALNTLRDAFPDVPFVLLAHYLHVIDPHQTSSSMAETERTVLPLFDGSITTSHYAKRSLHGEGMPDDDITVVPPGLDAAYRAPTAEPSAPSVPTFLTVSSLLPGKGLRPLVDCLERLSDLEWRWILVGDDTLDPSFAETVRERLRASSITDRTTLVGPVPPEKLRTYYDRADVFVLPSRFETCSMATREAMARGLPVVAYEVGGLPENLGDAAALGDAPAPGAASAGCLVPLEDPEAFTEALSTVLTNGEKRSRMADAARKRSDAFPTWADAATQFYTAIRSIQPAVD